MQTGGRACLSVIACLEGGYNCVDHICMHQTMMALHLISLAGSWNTCPFIHSHDAMHPQGQSLTACTCTTSNIRQSPCTSAALPYAFMQNMRWMIFIPAHTSYFGTSSLQGRILAATSALNHKATCCSLSTLLPARAAPVATSALTPSQQTCRICRSAQSPQTRGPARLRIHRRAICHNSITEHSRPTACSQSQVQPLYTGDPQHAGGQSQLQPLYTREPPSS
jgi:hypothetical protein